jgi:hypothetical protein
VDIEAFERDGYAVVRGAFGQDVARTCREMIWDVLAERGLCPKPLVLFWCQVPPGGRERGP